MNNNSKEPLIRKFKKLSLIHPMHSVHTHPRYSVLIHPRDSVLTHPSYSVLSHPKVLRAHSSAAG